MKNDEAALPGRPDNNRSPADQPSRASGRNSRATRPPTLRVEVALEQPGSITLDAETYEDELRLRAWLRRSSAFRNLPALLERLLDDLDECDRMAA